MEGFLLSNYNPEKILSLLRKISKCFQIKDNLYFCFDEFENLKYIYYLYKIKAIPDRNYYIGYKYWLISLSGNQAEIIIEGFFSKKKILDTEFNLYKEIVYCFSNESLIGLWIRTKENRIGDQYQTCYSRREMEFGPGDESEIKSDLFSQIKIPHVSFQGTTINLN
jgi:hypothetical protein